MSCSKTIGLLISIAYLSISLCDIVVQVNVNRPLNDVSEKFVSFTVTPTDLYKSLDGPNRKTMTRMAAMLSDSYVKFSGDYYFAADADIKIGNPTKVIWKGFNRWTRAVNWTMIIPVPYTPKSWDPVHALKIMNASYMVGIDDCIWQLGTDFGASRAQDYVNELKTFNLMSESFTPYVEDWKVMGADISAGSSAEETRHYVEISKGLNAAFGWTQTSNLTPTSSVANYIHEKDPALTVLLNKKVPVWLSFPQLSKVRRLKDNTAINNDEIIDGFRWAQTLGDAANMGFDAVFKRISFSELEKPNFSFYVTALFKKVMGSRVFPARPLNAIFAPTNKLYTHCANDISGGIAFMVVNRKNSPLEIILRSMSTQATTEIWQYALSYKRNSILLNNEKMTLNSTLKPQVKYQNNDNNIQINAPGMSVSFWVLPSANLEHCQFTEVEAQALERTSDEAKELVKRYSSSDKLIQKLIQETSLSHGIQSKNANRGRRYATFDTRSKRFILNNDDEKPNVLPKLFEPMFTGENLFEKHGNELQNRRKVAMQWLRDLMNKSLESDKPSPKRQRRSADDYFGSFFGNRDGRKTAFTKKITEIKKPEKKVKPIFNLDEFDEEEFFKKVSEQTEPERVRLPEGDVHIKHITNSNGEEIEDTKEEKRKLLKKPVKKFMENSKEAVSEMKPLRLLPTEFYEALPLKHFQSNKMGIGGALNSLLFPEPFSKAQTKSSKKSNKKQEEEQLTDSISEVEEIGTGKFHKSGQLAQDFLRAQKELSKSFMDEPSDNKHHLDVDEEHEIQLHVDKKIDSQKRKYVDKLTENSDNYFGENDETNKEKSENSEPLKKELDEVPWWELSELRRKRSIRALKFQIPDEAWQNNMINKDDELTPLGATIPEQQLATYEYNTVNDNNINRQQPPARETKQISNKLGSLVKEKVSKFVDIVTRHVNEWYSTITKHIEVTAVEASTPGNNVR